MPSFDDQIFGTAEDIFEINDFTVVTEYERFIVQLESILHDWNICGKRSSAIGNFDKKLKSIEKPVKFKDNEFNLIFYHFEDIQSPKDDSEITDEDDEEKMSYLPTSVQEMTQPDFDLRDINGVFSQYGILEHILLEPIAHSVNNQDLWRDLLSCFNVALSNSGCEIPMFVRYGDSNQHLFNGVCLNKNSQTIFEVADTKDYLKKLGYFSGLVDMFKEKVACEVSDLPPIEASVQFDYVYKNESVDVDNQSTDDELDEKPFQFEFEFGDNKNAIKKICLSVLWPRLNDETVNETDNFSDLDPYTSPRWLVNFELDGTRKMLFSTMDELLDTKEMPASENKVSYFVQSLPKEPKMAHALSGITQTHATETTDIGFISAHSSNERSQIFINNIIRQIFEDPFTKTINDFSEFQQKCISVLSRSKAALLDSLTSRISIALTKCLNTSNGIQLMCTLWMDFIDRLNLRWDNSENIPGIDVDSTPDLACCLFHQKLQMLQYCIETKRKRHDFMDKNPNQAMACSTSSSCSDIFFDAEDETAGPSKSTEDVKLVPKGRTEALDEHLIGNPSEYIYVPHTQDKGPMTEDMIDSYSKRLAAQSSDDRVKEQLDVLLSDMQAFKAANPGAQIEDFIYWHSPRDWIKDEDGNVTLSERMMMPDNIWLDTWKNARPIPVNSQPRLFNETKEAHSILQFFKDLSVRELIDFIQPSAFFSAGNIIVEKAKDAEPLILDELPELCRFIAKSTQRAFSEDYFDTYKKIDPIENKIVWLDSINKMLEKEIKSGNLEAIIDKKLVRDFAISIAQKNVTRILDAPNGALCMCIRQLMNNACQFDTHQLDEYGQEMEDNELKLPDPHRKHYIFRWIVPRPGLQSRKMPQRMYACVGERYFHVAGAFTDDSIFM